MTCIVAHRDGWIVADRGEVWGDNLIGPTVDKVQRVSGLLFALSGSDGAVLARLREEPAAATALVMLANVMRDAPGDDYSAIAVDDSGLWLICAAGSLTEVKNRDWWTMGSGADAASGYLAGAVAYAGGSPGVNALLAVEAVKFAATRRTGISSEVQVEYLNEAEPSG